MNVDKLLKCPRPSLYRDSFFILNGMWDFAFDDQNEGEVKGYQNGFTSNKQICVPFTYQSKASLIHDETRHDNIWYQKELEIKKDDSKRYLLHLEGLDYIGKVFLNGKKVGETKGAYFRHTLDLTPFVHGEKNLLVIKCEDDYSLEKPRGKQRSRDESYECFYVDTNGIYKDIWLETVSNSYISHVKITPDLPTKLVNLEVESVNAIKKTLVVNVISKNKIIKSEMVLIKSDVEKLSISLPNVTAWSINNPFLYDLEFKVIDNEKTLDEVKSYCGFRSLSTKDCKVYLNDEPLYQKLVLDQGYWKDTNLTSPGVDALLDDIKKMKAFGFNGCRKHQKIEDERFLLLCDVLGFVVWVEYPSAVRFSDELIKNYMYELPYILKQNYNHPSVITWTLFNESWGINDILNDKKVQKFTVDAYNFAKEYDPQRFVITNDGWEHTTSDIITFHHYEQDADKLYSYYEDKEKALTEIWKSHWKGAFANGYSYKGQPIIFSEFGGTAFNKSVTDKNWGYGQGVDSNEEYIVRVTSLIKALHKLEYLSGYCYTQVSDVEQEINGLLDHEHNMKVDPKKIRKVQDLK